MLANVVELAGMLWVVDLSFAVGAPVARLATTAGCANTKQGVPDKGDVKLA